MAENPGVGIGMMECLNPKDWFRFMGQQNALGNIGLDGSIARPYPGQVGGSEVNMVARWLGDGNFADMRSGMGVDET